MKPKSEYQPCNLCESVFQSILTNFKDMPVDRARAKALEEFYKMHDESDCIEFYTCLPITRASSTKSNL